MFHLFYIFQNHCSSIFVIIRMLFFASSEWSFNSFRFRNNGRRHKMLHRTCTYDVKLSLFKSVPNEVSNRDLITDILTIQGASFLRAFSLSIVLTAFSYRIHYMYTKVSLILVYAVGSFEISMSTEILDIDPAFYSAGIVPKFH